MGMRFPPLPPQERVNPYDESAPGNHLLPNYFVINQCELLDLLEASCSLIYLIKSHIIEPANIRALVSSAICLLP